MTSRYHGSKISGSQQSVMTETAICVVKQWKEIMGYHFVPECNHTQKSCMLNCFVFVLFFFFLPYLQDHALLRSRSFATMVT